MKFISFAIFILLTFMAKAEGFNLTGNDKAALLMVHFGTTFDDTRELTIDAINHKAAEAFPNMKIVEAYTSRIVISRLKKRGIVKSTPREMLLRLAADGYTHVFIQGTNIIYGIEAENLINEAQFMAPFFKDIRVGRPLLYSIEDCENVVEILYDRHKSNIGKNSCVILIGHGTTTPANAIYSQVDYMFGAEDHKAFHVATIEGYPTFETTLPKLKESKTKSVTLVPFMFVAGDHARNDIDTEWRNALEEKGFKVSTRMEGLGQIPQIQDIFINHINQGLNERPLNASEHKAAFLKENL